VCACAMIDGNNRATADRGRGRRNAFRDIGARERVNRTATPLPSSVGRSRQRLAVGSQPLQNCAGTGVRLGIREPEPARCGTMPFPTQGPFMAEIEHISDTARWVAVYRAMESARPD